MLKTPRPKQISPVLSYLDAVIGGSNKLIEEGIIECTNADSKWDVNHEGDIINWEYGVADNLEQIKNHYQHYINDVNLKMCITYFTVIKSEQPSEGGWRWHKWGNYIGNKNPQCEYIYDEDDSIEKVLVYSIYEVK